MAIIKDIYGTVEIPEGVLWGANTQRSLQNFPIGIEKMPKELIKATIQLKKATAQANIMSGVMEKEIGHAIIEACDELLQQDFMIHFPLSIWQTGSGTQTNMNVNEVIANYAMQKNPQIKVHPNDHVNKGQSSNDVFPTAMHICLVDLLTTQLLPEVQEMQKLLADLSEKSTHIKKTGRTHLQDATPITFGQEVSSWLAMFDVAVEQIESVLKGLRRLAIGGTAVGTGLNTYQGFGKDVCQFLNENLQENFVPTDNPFHAMSSKDDIVFCHGALNALASNTMKFANDIRWLASGPRCGIGELTLPANEAGSSIMPGKVNPTQAEALTMICVQVMANNQAVVIGASQGNFQLNVYMPLIIHNTWQSIRLLTDGLNSFRKRCIEGITVNEDKMKENLEKSLMTATYLNKKFGYDETATIVKEAHANNQSIKDVIVSRQLMTAEEFDQFFQYDEMIKPYSLEGEKA